MAISKLNPSAGGIPFGDTAGRPSNPVVGDTYYNGQLEILEIYNGTAWVANSAPPAVPSIVSVTDVGTGLAYATGGTFTVVVAPGSGGATALQYNALTTAGGFSATSSSTTISLTGLTPATSFSVVANAQNNFGTTVNSNPFSSVLATTVPQAPTIGTATDTGVVTWTLNSNGGKNLSSITITPYLNGVTAQTPTTADTTSSTSATISTGITEGSSYTFKVKTTNANGTSLESSATNSVTINKEIAIDYLVVAGGGAGGGGNNSGGGGAGGLRSTVTGSGGTPGTVESALSITKGTNYTVTVGAGGAGGVTNPGNNGSNSVFSTITSIGGGGGRGGNDSNTVGSSGGSGGGANYSTSTGTPGQGTANQGFAGGLGFGGNPPYGAGGGGGAAAVGANGSSGGGGNGGAGRAVSITGSSVTYAGGGGGRPNDPGAQGAGGAGGGAASATTTGGSGSANTGGGGGGSNTNGGSGGSGVVILRWLTSDGSITVGAGLTADATGTHGSYSYRRFTEGSGNVSFA